MYICVVFIENIARCCFIEVLLGETDVLICCLLSLYIFVDVFIVQVWVWVVYLEVGVLIECNGILLCCV